MLSSAPLIFIHYGPASYLRSVLQAARRTNPKKRIILLGDASNRRFARGVAEFFFFEDYAKGEAVQEFERVFQVIQGERHRYTKEGGVEKWLKFVFRRWFLIHEFLKNQNIDAFWTFDSDTLLLESLDKIQSRFAHVEGTTQCRGKCLNGWIGSRSLVERYVNCINEIFNDSAYLQAQKERLLHEVTLSFNEMDAFEEFCRRENVKTCRASEIIAGEAFDDALAMVYEYEPAPQKILNRTEVKRLWVSATGQLYIRTALDQEMVRLLSCNMSWMPDFFWRRLFKLTTPKRRARSFLENEKKLKEVSLDPSWLLKIKKLLPY
ncbi:MAG: hypothetical protein K2W97_01195 [Chthoniobacterales bacterium]|nr:hypothetical protein [Chthoniobacterales bacterium]